MWVLCESDSVKPFSPQPWKYCQVRLCEIWPDPCLLCLQFENVWLIPCQALGSRVRRRKMLHEKLIGQKHFARSGEWESFLKLKMFIYTLVFPLMSYSWQEQKWTVPPLLLIACDCNCLYYFNTCRTQTESGAAWTGCTIIWQDQAIWIF